MKQTILAIFLCLVVLISKSQHLLPLNATNAKQISNNYQQYYEDDNYAYIVQELNNTADLHLKNVMAYLSNNLYLIRYNKQEWNSKKQQINQPIYCINPQAKLITAIDDNALTEKVIIQLDSYFTDDEIQSFLQKNQINATKIDYNKNFVEATLPIQKINQLTLLPSVLFISKKYDKKNTLYSDSYYMNRLNKAQLDAPNGYDAQAQDISVGIWDEGCIGPHQDLPNYRVFNIDKEYYYSPYFSHPTYVAGAVGMQPNLSSKQYSAAAKAKLYSYDYYNDIIQEIISGIQNYDLSVTNHSYNFATTTCDYSGLYIPEAQYIDELANQYPKVTHVVAVGNSASTCSDFDSYHSVDIGYQSAKNTIVVGWLFADETWVGNSGRGPTTDGRLKPELVTKGFGYTATNPSGGFTATYGSSFAAPQVAGMAAALQGKYKEIYNDIPNAALVKSILCNTAEDLGNPAPDYSYGFGRPDMGRALETLTKNWYIEDIISSNQSKIYNLNITEEQQLKLTLCWTDLAAFPLADKILVNDLDVVLVTPSLDTILPWTLDPNNYTANAVRKKDQLNNIEQITHNNLAAGNYQIIIKANSLQSATQQFAVSYYKDDAQLDIVHPDGGEVLNASATYPIKWNNKQSTTGNIAYSIDGGTSWNTIATDVDMSVGSYSWTTPSVTNNIDSCLIMIEYNGIQDTSNAYFTIAKAVASSNIIINTCNQNANISWTATTNTDKYYLYLLEDGQFRFLDSTNTNNYNLFPIIEGKGYGIAISTKYNDIESNKSDTKTFSWTSNSCTNTNDIGVVDILQPKIGRQFTQTQLTSNEQLAFVVKNLGVNTVNGFFINYKINNGLLKTLAVNHAVIANALDTVYFSINEDLSAIGNYTVVAYTVLPLDTFRFNDTLHYTIKHLANLPITLPWTENYEFNSTVITANTFGIDNMQYSDFYTAKAGRLRTDLNNVYAKDGVHCLNFDNYLDTDTATVDYIITLNLSNYIDSILYLDFDYTHHNEQVGNDFIFARGSDADTWINIYDLFTNKPNVGEYKSEKYINLYELLKVQNNQDFSSSFQIKIQLQLTNRTSNVYNNGGYAFDNLKIYNAGNDATVNYIQQHKAYCSSDLNFQPITINVKNNTTTTYNNVIVKYSINGTNTITETILQLLPFENKLYSFTTLPNITTQGSYAIKAWVENTGDVFKQNDSSSILDIVVLPSVNQFPYYNSFEQEATMLATGENSSWQWTQPYKYYTRKAAEGNNAWTNTQYKTYNYNEKSYLYAGCYNFSAFTQNPNLSINHIQDIEFLSDSVFAEYSSDGVTWQRLGCKDCGYNWYNNLINNYWQSTTIPWQVATTKIPIDDFVDKSNVRIRFKLNSDAAGVGEGLAIDDLHIYEQNTSIATADSVYLHANSTGSGWVYFYNNGLIVAKLNDNGTAYGNITLAYNVKTTNIDAYEGKVLVPRNWYIHSDIAIQNNILIYFYLLNDECLAYMLEDDSAFCMNDIAMLHYNGFNENLSLKDNFIRGNFQTLSPSQVQFQPYQRGYQIACTINSWGEYYLIGEKLNEDKIPTIVFSDLNAIQVNDDALVNWQTAQELNAVNFIVQYSFDGINFINLDTVPATGNSTSQINYNYIDIVNAINGTVLYYRIIATDVNDKQFFSLVDSIHFAVPTSIKEQTTTIKAYFANQQLVIDNQLLLGNYQVQLIDIVGKSYINEQVNFNHASINIPINQYKSMAVGTYILLVNNNKQRYFVKLFKY
ncbi:MAG: S8 family serine peptidase [Chitinophagales bacterium]|nr:S8 family serine peptidase [Chitinophagales bacterium]